MCLANACKDFMRLYEYAGWSESSLDLLAILYVLLCTVYSTITFNRSCNVSEGKSEWKKNSIRCQTYAKQKTISNSNSFSVLGIPSTDSRHNGKCNICAFHAEINAFETGFLSDYQVLFLLLNGPQIETSL